MAPLPQTAPTIKNAAAAPMIFFDSAPTYGILAGVVEILLTARYLLPKASGQAVHIDFTTTAHLRCSIEAARNLRNALDGAIAMAEKQAEPVKLAS
jgi:hypothetical protein